MGVRGRLTLALVALVALTVAVLGTGAYAFVDASLRQGMRDEAEAQARLDLTVFAPLRLQGERTREAVVASRIVETFRSRGVDTIVDVGDGDPVVSRLELASGLERLSGSLRETVGRGELAYEWTTLADRPVLVLGGRMPPDGPAFYFLRDARPIETALGQLRLALAAGGLGLAVVALVLARTISRGVLAPIYAASRTAERIERGDRSARVPVTSKDEFGRWAERFNRMAAALDDTIRRLEAAEARNRRFAADVSHELRTPLTALVAEASILRDHLDEMPPGARRAGELLVGDVERLRTLVGDVIELSRFDDAVEHADPRPVDLGRLVSTVVMRRLPAATLDLPELPLVVATDPRRVDRILANLVDNAAEHAPGSPVEVVLRLRPDGVAISVADRGPGVPDDQLERIFDRFVKLDRARPGGGSRGLGLAIAAEHAAVLGGSLQARNRSGGGLEVELRLPVTGSLPAGDDPVVEDVDPSARTSSAGGIRP